MGCKKKSLLACKFGSDCSLSPTSSDSSTHTSRPPTSYYFWNTNLNFQTLTPPTCCRDLCHSAESASKISTDPAASSLYLNLHRPQRPRRACTFTRYRCPEFFPRIILRFFIKYALDRDLRFHCNILTGLLNALSIILPKSAAKRGLRAASRLRIG